MTNIVKMRSKKPSKELLEDFSIAYAKNGGDHVAAYIEAGFSERTAPQNALKYLNKNHEYVMKIVKRTMGQTSALGQKLILQCAEDENIPWGVRLKAIEMMLKNSGIQKDTLVIEDNSADDMSPEQRDAEIAELMKRMGNA